MEKPEDTRLVMDWPAETRPARRRKLPLLGIVLSLIALGFLAHLQIAEFGRRLALEGSTEGTRLAAERHAQRRAALEQNYAENLAMALGGRAGGPGQTCTAHQDHLAAALRLYSHEHGGQFPHRLSDLVPNYVDRLPSCPSAGQDTYTAGYAPSADRLEFDLCCKGDNHHDEYSWTEKPTTDLPGYNSVKGWTMPY